MGTVMPFKRAASIEQCRQVSDMEDLTLQQVRLWFAWMRVVNRIWWGA